MPTSLRQITPFLTGLGLYLVFISSLLLLNEKGDFVLWLNAFHQPYLDTFFAYYTFVGDGIFYAIVVIILFFMHKRAALIGLLSFALSGGIAQGLKRLVFAEAPRPKAFFGDSVDLHFVEGVSVHLSNSFPSGHTTTAFSVFCLLALYYPRSWWQILCLVLAILGAVSRVYLVQHFLVDTLFGAIIGTTVSLLVWSYFMLKRKPEKTLSNT